MNIAFSPTEKSQRHLAPHKNAAPIRAWAAGIVAASLLSGAAPGANLTMTSGDRQAINGWGVFPGYSHSNWGAPYQSVADRPAIRDAIFNLNFNYIRVELASNSYSATAPNNIDTTALDQLKTQILMAKSKGVNNWIVSSWSPPAPFKTPIQATSGQVNGTVTYFNTAYTEQFCQYYANALAYLRDNGCGTPVTISLQNEPNWVVSYDGCSFYAKADYQQLLVRMRYWLNNTGLSSVRLGASEAAAPGDPVFTGNGNNFWADIASMPVDDAITHTYGGAGWDFYQFSLAPKPIWVTEWSDIDGDTSINAPLRSASHIARDLVTLNASYWVYWNAYNYSDTPGSADLVYGTTTPSTTQLYHVLRRLFTEVKPDGSFKVRAFTSDDTDFQVGNGADDSQLVNVIGFHSGTKTVVLVTNMTSVAKSVVLNGIPASALERFETSATTASGAEMDDKGSVSITSGSSAVITIPASTVQIFTSAPASLVQGALPAAWTDSDIGSPGVTGSAAYDAPSGNWTIAGGGTDIWNGSDQFNYASTAANGDSTVIAEITSLGNTDGWAKGGVMFRDSAASNSMFADVVSTAANGVCMQWRNSTGGGCGSVGIGGIATPSASNPAWLKLVKSGSTYTGYYSANGSTWTTVGSTSIAFGNSTYLGGLAVTAHNGGLISTALFSNVSVTSGPSAGAWYRLTPRHATGMALDVNGGSQSNGANVQIWTWLAGTNQEWQFQATDSGYYRIVPRSDPAECLDISGGQGATANGTPVQQWAYNGAGGTNQQWRLDATDSGYYRLTPRNASVESLDVNGASSTNGTQVQIWQYVGGSNQQWMLQAQP